jgi:Rad3-related DNA helicase
MLKRLALMAVRSYVGGPAKSWVFTSGAMLAFRLVKSVTGRRELVDLSTVKPGQTLIIEHLPISHKRQMKDIKRSKRQERKDRRKARKAVTADA